MPRILCGVQGGRLAAGKRGGGPLWGRAMIPVGDNVARRRAAPANTALIAINLLVFCLVTVAERRGFALARDLALVPRRLSVVGWATLAAAAGSGGVWPPLTLVSSLFVHGDALHVAGNMLYLLIFGPAVEQRFGVVRYGVFYLLAGVVSGLATVATAPFSRVAVVGASGAIAGVLGSYFVFYPRGRIRTWVPPFYFLEVPALFYLLLWFALQLLLAAAAGGEALASGGVAWWAHVSGFLFGVGAGPWLAGVGSRRRRRR